MKNQARRFAGIVVAGLTVSACLQAQDHPFTVEQVAQFNEPWAMAFLPDGRMLVTEKPGTLQLFDPVTGEKAEIDGVPEVAYGSQGGFGDVVLHPDYAQNSMVYLSFSEPGERRTAGATVVRARLELDATGGELTDLEVIWRQVPKVTGGGHFGQRIAFADGYLWISAGERQKGDPAQDLQQTLGKIVRLNHDGSVPGDNPFADQGGVAAEVWSLGHRNPLGLQFDSNGQLWNVEMGPRGGDELNRVVRGGNYGWYEVSNGSEYSGQAIPDHDTRPEFNTPAVFWVPSISPSSLLFYSGDQFADWQGDALIGGLSSQSIVRVEFDGESAYEAERYDMEARIRGVVEGPDGAIWVLEDGSRGGSGYLNKLTPD